MAIASSTTPQETDIRESHQRCRGNLVREYEELLVRGATLSSQARTGSCRRHGIGFEPPKPAGRYPSPHVWRGERALSVFLVQRFCSLSG